MSVTLLAQKGKMGDNTYYITTMKANTLIKTVGYACEMEKWPDMTVDERMQREIKGDRVVSEIVPYIVNDPEWFFGSLIIDVYSGWEQVEFQDIQEVCQTKLAAYKETLRDAGFLRNDLVPHPEIGNADVTVIFIKHESDTKIRKIFNKVNRYAKQTSKGDNIITSEDDMIAIITRAMFSGSEDAPLRPINNQELVNWKSNTIPRRSRMLTTAAAIYTMTEVLLEYYDITSKTRRDEEKLEQGMKFMKEFWNKTMSEVNAFKDYQKYISDGNSLEAYRKKNLLLKPVTQMALSQAVRLAMDYGFVYEDLIPKINKINWDPGFYAWSNVLVTTGSSKKMITGSQALKDAGSLIAYMLVGEKYNKEEQERLLKVIREANDNEEAELPPVVELGG